MSKSDSALKIRLAQLGDQESISNFLFSFKLPLDGLKNTKMWVLIDTNGNIFGTAGLEMWGQKGLLRSVAVKKNFKQSRLWNLFGEVCDR